MSLSDAWGESLRVTEGSGVFEDVVDGVGDPVTESLAVSCCDGERVVDKESDFVTVASCDSDGVRLHVVEGLVEFDRLVPSEGEADCVDEFLCAVTDNESSDDFVRVSDGDNESSRVAESEGDDEMSSDSVKENEGLTVPVGEEVSVSEAERAAAEIDSLRDSDDDTVWLLLTEPMLEAERDGDFMNDSDNVRDLVPRCSVAVAERSCVGLARDTEAVAVDSDDGVKEVESESVGVMEAVRDGDHDGEEVKDRSSE